MPDLSGFPYVALRFDKEARLLDEQALADFKTRLGQEHITDLVVISHGWNNDMQEAEALYAELMANARELLNAQRVPRLAGRAIAVLGVLWPSKKFADAELIPGGAATLQGSAEENLVRQQLLALRQDAGTVFDAPNAEAVFDELLALLPKVEDSSKRANEFLDKLRSLVQVRDDEPTEISSALFELPAGELLEHLKQPVPRERADGDDAPVDEDSGGAAGLGDVFGGVISGVRNALNLVTYYQMKARAGQVGAQGLNPVLRGIAAQFPALRLHLVGHSFGGRLVTAATAGADASTLCPVASLSLLQAAFSHYGFAQNWDGKKSGGQDGFFRRVVVNKAVRGPVIATCTANDKAVGLAYPLASMLAQQVGAELGDKNDKYGGMGRNGAQKTPEAVDAELLASDAGRSYAFNAGRIHNLQAGNLITSHGDVRNAAVAYAVLSAMAAATV